MENIIVIGGILLIRECLSIYSTFKMQKEHREVVTELVALHKASSVEEVVDLKREYSFNKEEIDEEPKQNLISLEDIDLSE